jgi:GT2 family glycosyltransferase
MLLSIVIVNYNTKTFLEDCLKSIFQGMDLKDKEVIIIDNNSTDGSPFWLKTEFPQVKLIENKKNLGFAKACNQGIEISSGKFIFFLNPDAYVTPDIWENIFAFMESHPQVGLGGCYIFYPDGKPQICFHKFSDLFNTMGRMFSFFRFLPRFWLTEPFFWDYPTGRIPETVDRVMGSAMVLRRTASEEVGGLDENLFMYAEEEDLCYRLKEKGWLIAPIPNTKVYHFHQQSSLQNIKESTFHKFRSEFLVFRKYSNKIKTILFRLIQWLGAFLRIIFWCGALIFHLREKKVAKEKIKGYGKIVFSTWNYSNF